MLAITHARAVPAIDENPVHLVARHDLAALVAGDAETWEKVVKRMRGQIIVVSSARLVTAAREHAFEEIVE